LKEEYFPLRKFEAVIKNSRICTCVHSDVLRNVTDNKPTTVELLHVQLISLYV